MASSSNAHPTMPPLPAVQRYFEVSLFLLVSTGILAVVSSGKLDVVSRLLAPAALAYKSFGVWHARRPELSARVATWLVLASILASAILTVETGFLLSLAIFLVLAVSTFVALEMRRSAGGTVSPPL